MTRLKMPIRQVVNGVAMDGQKTKWLSIQPRKKHTTNYRQLRDMSTIVDDQELMEDI